MNDEQFKTLTRSYLRRDISKTDLSLLKAVLEKDADRKWQFESACKEYQQRKLGSGSHVSGSSSRSSSSDGKRRRKRHSSTHERRRVSDAQLLIYTLKMEVKKFIYITLRRHYGKVLAIVATGVLALSAFYYLIHTVLVDDEHAELRNIEENVKFKQETYGRDVFTQGGIESDVYNSGFKALELPDSNEQTVGDSAEPKK